MSLSNAASLDGPESVKVAQQLHYIGGEFVSGAEGRTFATLNPATNAPIADTAEGTAEDVARAVSAAKRAFDDGAWSTAPATERARVLRQIAQAIRDDADDFVGLEVLDIGMPITQMRQQAERAAHNFDYFADVVCELDSKAHRVGLAFLNYAFHRPVGIAGLITPWNSPLMLASWKLAPALAAGNATVLKPAEWSPLTGTRLAAAIATTDLPDGIFNVVHGFGETAGASLVAHEDVRLISFTGETKTGAEIIRNGGATLTRYSFELGGKSPVVVFDDVDLDRAVDAIVFQIFSMNGQRCTAGSRLIAQEGIYEELVARVAERARAMRVGDPFDPATELGPLIRSEHHERVTGFLAETERTGARLLAGGARPEGLPHGNFLDATVFADVTPDMRIWREEVFGPVLVATSFATEAEAIALANDTRYGLAGYVWCADGQRSQRVAQQIETGMVWVNSQNVRDLTMPFGGSKDSGIGREGGHYSFEFFSDLQTVHYAMGEHSIPRLGLGD